MRKISCSPAIENLGCMSWNSFRWTDAAGQIKTVVDSVVFPALSLVLAIAFFVKLAMAYFDYRKHGQFEFAGPAILFACLLFTLTAPLYIWGVVGM